ncbi:Inherit from NOG: AvrBs3 and PthA family of transcription activator-like effector proteins [Seminavis robusta]|uniref:Inherit from NOG: AvrBs3 and PthA family of transcription activator-like effector proteins n=1 Tax=Seminavis robusta TaxID=568900 RepID=A0A9N8E758_9STRA|nr:Inherit from NOG: AvrBs3 and PthA family of transcription activator-like effector proteins [Seminavis robusta]|eukprot:Sro737_g195200.1 Inherit from NOG: AvrBs3 and PthA family of transcription activator-like effector proteins (677) ;mRNA; r:43264-45294
MSDFFRARTGAAKKRKTSTPSGRLSHSIFTKPKGWKTTIIKAFSTEDREERYSKPTKASKGKDIPHMRVHCGLKFSDGSPCNAFRDMQVESGYGNFWKHLLTHFDNKEDDLMAAYVDATLKAASKGGCAMDHAEAASFGAKENAMYDWIDLMVMENLPLSAVESKRFRRFSRYSDETVFGHKMIRDTMFHLKALTQGEVVKAVKKAPLCDIIHDGWTCDRTHFFGLICSFNKTRTVIEDGKKVVKEEVETVLLSVAPITRLADDSANVEEASSFTAQVHCDYIQELFEELGIDFDKWVFCQTADNCSTNLKLAKDLGIPHVGCMSHKFNLDVKDMIKNEAALKDMLGNIHTVITAARSSIRNMAVIRNLTAVGLAVPSEPRWSGEFNMIFNYGLVWDSFRRASIDHECTDDFTDNLCMSQTHFQTVQKKSLMLKELNDVTKPMQRRHCNLLNCANPPKLLEEKIADKKANNETEHPLYECTFERNRTMLHGPLATHVDFESAVVKVQKGEEATLLYGEKAAIKSALKTAVALRGFGTEVDTDDEVEEATTTTGSPGLYKQALKAEAKRMAHREGPTSKYINLDFVLGSAAEVERLWSLAKYVLINQRKSMTPTLFECLMYLKYNRGYWNKAMVAEAYRRAREQQSDARFAKWSAQAEEELQAAVAALGALALTGGE